MKVRILEPSELKRTPQPTKVDLSPYREILLSIPEGGGLDVTLEDGESSRTIKRRFTTASKELGKKIAYRSTKEGNFRIVLR